MHIARPLSQQPATDMPWTGGGVPADQNSLSQKPEVRAVESFSRLSANERLAWNALFKMRSDSVPFQSLAWNENWWKAFGPSSRLTTNDALILVVSCRNEIIAFFPMFRVTLSVLGVALLRHVKPMGSDSNLTEVKTGIVREGRERAAYAALSDYFENVDRRWELMNFPAVPAGVLDAGDALFIEHPTVPLIEGFTIALAGDWNAFHRGLKHNVKEAIRRSHNKLKRDGLKPVFTCLSNSADIRDMLPEFYRLHSERSRKQDGAHHLDYFQPQKVRSFIELLANDPANSGIRLFVLRDRGRLVAARLAFETPRDLFILLRV